MSINDSMSRVRTLLLSPQSQSPTVDQLFTHLTDTFQDFYNSLSSTNRPWTYNSVTVNTIQGTMDYYVPITPGKVMFVTGMPQIGTYGPIALSFADLADVSSEFYLFGADYIAFSPDFNESINYPFTTQIAFYRQDNDLWFRIAPFVNTFTSITIAYATGDWLQNLTVENTAVLSNHHPLVHTRTALNLLPACQWSNDEKANQLMRTNLAQSLSAAEARYAQQFLYAKRMLTDDEVGIRDSGGDGWGWFVDYY